MSRLRKRRLLFFAEAATLSHVVRPWVFATGVDFERYEVVFCRHPRFDKYFTGYPSMERVFLDSQSTEQFLQNLYFGRAIFNEQTLDSYVQEDLKLIDKYEPDVVIGDLRLSLAISSRVRGIPYVNVCNAYWNSNNQSKLPIPDVLHRRLFGRFLGQKLFNLVGPSAFKLQGQPMNRLCRKYGVPGLEGDVRTAYLYGDYVVFCDLPEGYAGETFSGRHIFVGPVLWRPHSETPIWWDKIPEDRPSVFVSLGSSGNSRTLPKILGGLRGLPISVLVSTLGNQSLRQSENIYLADMIPTDLAAAKSRVTICNGGSSVTYQALAMGASILSVPSNLDQYLNTQRLEKLGVACRLEGPDLGRLCVGKMVMGMISDSLMTQRVKALSETIGKYSASQNFNQLLEGIFPAQKQEAA